MADIGGFEADLSATAARVEAVLRTRLAPIGGRLGAAMRHAALGGGKRLRPFVVLRAAALFGIAEAVAMPAACALELLHCYSLVHDDLPAMDDDDLRRGLPTVHRAFDEATAILAGDGLLTLAFETLADPTAHSDAAVRAELVVELARAGGTNGMIGGQMRDLAAEGRFAAGLPLTLSEAEIATLQAMKTGALFRFAALAGAILGGAGEADRQRLAAYGAALGRAFQIADDLLDEEASADQVGKATAKDRTRGKATLPALIGPGAARDRLGEAVAEASAALAGYGDRAAPLVAAAQYAAARQR